MEVIRDSHPEGAIRHAIQSAESLVAKLSDLRLSRKVVASGVEWRNIGIRLLKGQLVSEGRGRGKRKTDDRRLIASVPVLRTKFKPWIPWPWVVLA